MRRSMETVLVIPSSWIVCECCWMLSTMYGPDARHSNLLYRRLAISSAASDRISAGLRRSTNTNSHTLNVSFCRTSLSKSHLLVAGLWTVGLIHCRNLCGNLVVSCLFSYHLRGRLVCQMRLQMLVCALISCKTRFSCLSRRLRVVGIGQQLYVSIPNFQMIIT